AARVTLALNNALQYEANLREKQDLEKESLQLERQSRETITQLEQQSRETITQLEQQSRDTYEALQQKLTARYEAVEERLQEQVLVYQVSRALSRTLDLRQVLDSVRTQLDAWFGPAALTLALYDETRHELSYPLVTVGGQLRSQPAGAPEGVLRH